MEKCWSQGQPRQHHTATLLANGRVLVAGGDNYFGGVLPALLPDGKVLIAGGFNTSDTGPTAELFDPASAVEAAPFLLTQPTKLQIGAFQFTFNITPGLSFTVMSATNLTEPPANWAPRGATEVLPGIYRFTDASPHGQQRVYVVRSP